MDKSSLELLRAAEHGRDLYPYQRDTALDYMSLEHAGMVTVAPPRANPEPIGGITATPLCHVALTSRGRELIGSHHGD